LHQRARKPRDYFATLRQIRLRAREWLATSATLDGLLIGLGLEYAFFNNWTAKFEYDYLGFDSKNVSLHNDLLG
jgi:opacity protein-like surface antigen